MRHDGLLVRHGYVQPNHAEGAHAGEGLGQGGGRNPERRVHIVEIQHPKRGVVHSRRRRMRDRVAHDAEHPRRRGNHPSNSSTKQLAISKDSRHDTP